MSNESNAEEVAESFSRPCYTNAHACAIDRANCSCGHCVQYRAIRNAIEDAEQATRERDAQIAESWSGRIPGGDTQAVIDEIAAGIREGNQCPT